MARYTMPPAWSAAGAYWGRDGLLYLGVWRRGFAPGELQAMFYDCQQVCTLKRERDAARRELATAEARIEALERSVFWYRRQVTAEGRLGLMLAGLQDNPGSGQALL